MGRNELPITSLRSQRLFLFAVAQTVDALSVLDGELPEAFLEALDRQLDLLLRPGRFPESRLPPTHLEQLGQDVRALHSYFVEMRRRYIEHERTLSDDQREQMRQDRDYWNDILDSLENVP